VRGASSTFGGRGRSEKSAGMDADRVDGSVLYGGSLGATFMGVGIKRFSVVVGGVGPLEMLVGVAIADGRGLFFERDRDEGADKKSSGISFHCSVVLGTRVVLDGARFIGMRGGAEVDLGGGGGRFGRVEAGGGVFGGGAFSLLTAGFLSQPDKEDWSMIVDGVRIGGTRTFSSNV
jgi:hypothetical protein